MVFVLSLRVFHHWQLIRVGIESEGVRPSVNALGRTLIKNPYMTISE